MNVSRPLVFASSTSTGFSLVALVEYARHVDWTSLLALAGSVISTGIGWYIAHRNELLRAKVERDHIERQAVRDEQLADLITAMKIEQTLATERRGKIAQAMTDGPTEATE